ncbi:hypothetical protein PMIN07_009487 [Paraphaeosphaeria minitans]
MALSLYAPLPADKFSIRLIKLQPSEDPSAPIHCKLVTYPVDGKRLGAHSYECLSYVWGLSENLRSINIEVGEAVAAFKATPNLYEALLHLRDPFFELILWVDAICINQDDDKEKATQVAAMATIYGLARRIVVWLGPEADDSTFAFQRLRDLAQASQPKDENRFRERLRRENNDNRDPVGDRDVNSGVGSNVYKASKGQGVEEAIRKLLNRAYFCRMWILQEVTAARSMMFKCGDAEIQATTFVAGLDALERFDHDWELRSRIDSFLLLVKASAFRENMKGQAHLNIEPLANLIDRFHAHASTDPRDKIYALWGLCSDSASMENLRPNYTKSWKTLAEDLGDVVFGSNSTVSASPDRQMMFVRTTGHVLGEINIESPSYTPKSRSWDSDTVRRTQETIQTLSITSLRASTVLSPYSGWFNIIEMRASAEQIREGDRVLYLPHVHRIVFARRSEYYYRILMTVDTQDKHFGPNSAWYEGPNNMDDVESSLPLLWSWETHYEQEEHQCLELMASQIPGFSSSPELVHAQALCQARALSEMAELYMEYKEYALASISLANLEKIYTIVYGKDSEPAVASLQRMNDALGRNANYLKAKSLLQDSDDPNSSSEFLVACATLILDESMIHKLWWPPQSVLVDLASKEMAKGVSRELVIQALEQCEDFEKSASNHMSDEYTPGQKPILTAQGYNDYLLFLLDFAEDDIAITESELFVAAHKRISESNFIGLAKRIGDPLQNLPAILEALRSTQWPGLTVPNLITELGDRIIVTPDAVNVAAKWDVHALSALLRAAKGRLVVAPVAFTIAMQNPSSSTPAIIELLAQHAAAGCVVPKETLELIAWNASFEQTQLQWMFISLLENVDIVVDVSDDLLAKAAPASAMALSNIVCFTRAWGFPTTFDSYSGGNRDRLGIPYGEGVVNQVVTDDLLANNIIDYASFINLVRYWRNDFIITESLILRAANERKKHAEDNAWLYGEDQTPWRSLLVIDRCTAFFTRHADQDVIDSLIRFSALIDTAASRGLPRAIEAIHGRSHNTDLNLDALRVVAELCQLFQRPLEPGESFAHMPKIESLIRNLSGMAHSSVSEGVKREMFLHARGGQYNYQVIEMLLEYGIIDADAVKIWDGQSLDTQVVGYRDDQHPETRAGHQENYIKEC